MLKTILTASALFVSVSANAETAFLMPSEPAPTEKVSTIGLGEGLFAAALPMQQGLLATELKLDQETTGPQIQARPMNYHGYSK